jgi:hypothetical protein
LIGGGGSPAVVDTSASAKTDTADAPAYRDGLKRIPEVKVDAWGNMR